MRAVLALDDVNRGGDSMDRCFIGLSAVGVVGKRLEMWTFANIRAGADIDSRQEFDVGAHAIVVLAVKSTAARALRAT
jgi:hypothetical protein